MSSDEHADAVFEAIGGDDLPHQEFQKLHTLLNVGTQQRPGKSFRFIAEPCDKHAANPPGAQTWKDGDVDPVTGLAPKDRDPNGFQHGCKACEANATVIEEG
jgi:hypothetical protein